MSPCENCSATGRCRYCGGDGTLICTTCNGSGKGASSDVSCQSCFGMGRKNCERCFGSGKCEYCQGRAERE